MNRPCAGRILLVGEGDFSFSVALRNQLRNVQMVSSAFLGEDEIQVHKYAQDNVEILKEKGVTVLCNVDATQLDKDKRLSAYKFSRVIFNFPHVGGKSNIKKNRTLLQNFFASTAECLVEGGEVCVSLCRGQGGTPADTPVRHWSDTWQVVAMAAYSDFVLTETVMFVAGDFPEYNCTGYRSRDNFFHTEGAVTHIFKRAEPMWIPRDVISLSTTEFDGVQYQTNSYVVQSAAKFRSCTSNDNHILTMSRESLETEVGKNFPCRVQEVSVPHAVQRKEGGDSTSHYVLHQVTTPTSSSLGAKQFAIGVDPSAHKFLRPCEGSAQTISCLSCVDDERQRRTRVTCRAYHPQVPGAHALRRSLLESLLQTTLLSNYSEEGVLYVASGDCYQKCRISSDKIPVRYEMIWWRKSCDSASFQRKFTDCFSEVLLMGKKQVHTVPATNSGEALKEMTVERVLLTDVPNECPMTLPCNVTCNNRGGKRTWEGASVQPAEDSGACRREQFAFLGYLKDDPCVQLCVCFIDALSQALFALSDVRLLLSDSMCVFDTKPKPEIPVSPPILHAPEWKHDISFWVDSDAMFDEQMYTDVVRDHVGDCVRDVQLMNVWTPPGEKRTSRCYRHSYQPSDQAVSYHRAHEFQRLLRLKLAHALNIELR